MFYIALVFDALHDTAPLSKYSTKMFRALNINVFKTARNEGWGFSLYIVEINYLGTSV